MSTYVAHPGSRAAAREPILAWIHVRWLASGVAAGFLVPYVLADRLELSRDLYVGLYAASVLALFVAWARTTGQPLVAMLRRRAAAAAVLGVAFAGVLAVMVVRSEDAGARPESLDLVWAVAWRGVVYGLADGILLSAFPILAVFAAFSSTALRKRLLGKVAIGAVALVASLGMTAAYHAGYSDFRSAKLTKPLAGDVAWSVPTLLTLNPIGAPVAHAGMHVTAVLHNPDTETFLPPHR